MTDLDLDIAPRTRGPAVTPIKVTVVREINDADIVLLNSTPRAVNTTQSTVKKLRDSHHSVARALAMGYKRQEVSIITGYSPERITQLERDPAFQELLGYYREAGKASVTSNFADRLEDVRNDCIQMLHEAIHDEEDPPKRMELLKILEMTMDRSGFGPAMKNTQVNLNVSLAGRWDSAMKRLQEFDSARPTLAGSTERGADAASAVPSPPLLDLEPNDS